jgi:hypothetical protein
MERSSRATALAPLTGALFVVLILVSLAVGGEPPAADDSIEDIIDYWADNDTAVMVASVVEALGAVALVFFAASLRRLLQRDDDSSMLPMVAFGGGIVAAAGVGVDAALRFAAADMVNDVDPVVIQTINGLWSNFFFPMVIGVGSLILATSLAALSSRIIPLWMSIIGFVIFVALFTPAGFIAFLVGGLWVIVLSILLWRRESRAATGPVASPIPLA